MKEPPINGLRALKMHPISPKGFQPLLRSSENDSNFEGIKILL